MQKMLNSLESEMPFADDGNYEERLAIGLLLDVSGSTAGSSIRALNSALPHLGSELMKHEYARRRAELCLVTFGGSVKATEFCKVPDFSPPLLSAGGGTPMGEAINLTLDLIEARKQSYKSAGIPYYRPWVFLFTDGEPTDSFELAARRVHEMERQKKVVFFGIGFDGANMEVLTEICPPTRKPLKLNGLDFQEFFVWLGPSANGGASAPPNQPLVLPPPGWAVIEN